jgi:solute carrier family 25 (mitochondrial citrate transporter), member 1
MLNKVFDLAQRTFAPSPVNCSPHGGGDKNSGFVKMSISGGITGGIEACITYPTEFVKTMQQLYPEKKIGPIDTAKETIRSHGVKGLYRGLSCLLFFAVPKTGVRFGSKSFYDEHVFGNKKGSLISFVSGAMAGATEAVFVVTPQETLKVKLIHDRVKPNPKYSGFFNGVSTIYTNEGFNGVYKGLVPTVLRQSSNQAIRFLVYDYIKGKLDSAMPGAPLTVRTAAAGALAGAASVMGNNPIDVVKTLMQGLDAKKYNGSVDCFVKVWKNEGVRGFYRGVEARMTRVVLDVAITFTLVEHIRLLLDKLF